MRNLHLIHLLFSFLILSSACQSDDAEASPPLPEDDTFLNIKVDNINWSSSSFSASYINEIISIEAKADNGSTLEISVQNVDKIEVYSLGNVSIGTFEEGSGNDETFTTAGTLGTGSITFTVLNSKRAEGSLQFTGGNGLGQKKTISGSFKMDLIK